VIPRKTNVVANNLETVKQNSTFGFLENDNNLETGKRNSTFGFLENDIGQNLDPNFQEQHRASLNLKKSAFLTRAKTSNLPLYQGRQQGVSTID